MDRDSDETVPIYIDAMDRLRVSDSICSLEFPQLLVLVINAPVTRQGLSKCNNHQTIIPHLSLPILSYLDLINSKCYSSQAAILVKYLIWKRP